MAFKCLFIFKKKKSQTSPSACGLCPRIPFVVRVVHRFPRQATEMSRLPNKNNWFWVQIPSPLLSKILVARLGGGDKRFEFDLKKTKILERFP